MSERELIALMSAILRASDMDNEDGSEPPQYYVSAALDLLAMVDRYLSKGE